jgi:hypothetical protein
LISIHTHVGRHDGWLGARSVLVHGQFLEIGR